MPVDLASKLISTLGNPSSRVPLMVKDLSNSITLSYFSYKAGGPVEGKDRFIDEFGTEAIWLGGLPFFKKLMDMTFYKAHKLSPDVDVRVLTKNTEYLKLAKEHTIDAVKENLKNAEAKLPTFKKLFYAKFGVATILTLASYLTLTKLKQYYTRKNIEKDFFAKKANEEFLKSQTDKKQVFSAFTGSGDKKHQAPSFGNSFAKVMEGFMFNPVNNMFIIDGGITGERLTNSRTKGEFIEYAIKEGTFLFFMYAAGKYIQKGIEGLSSKIFKKPINLDANLLGSQELKEALSDKNALKEGLEALKNQVDDTAMYKFLFENKSPLINKLAGKAGVISLIKGNVTKNGQTVVKEMIDGGKFIDPEKVKEFTKNLEKLIEKFEVSKEAIEPYLKKTKVLKVGATLTNLAVCCFALSIVIPKLIFKLRKERQKGSEDFHVKNEYEKTLALSFKAKQP